MVKSAPKRRNSDLKKAEPIPEEPEDAKKPPAKKSIESLKKGAPKKTEVK